MPADKPLHDIIDAVHKVVRDRFSDDNGRPMFVVEEIFANGILVIRSREHAKLFALKYGYDEEGNIVLSEKKVRVERRFVPVKEEKDENIKNKDKIGIMASRKLYTEAPAKLDRCVEEVTKQKVEQFKKRNDRAPDKDERKEIVSSAFAICKSRVKGGCNHCGR